MGVDVRFDDAREVDEIVGDNCSVHLERLSADTWSLVVETAKGRGMFTLYRKGKEVRVKIYEVDFNKRAADTSSESRTVSK